MINALFLAGVKLYQILRDIYFKTLHGISLLIPFVGKAHGPRLGRPERIILRLVLIVVIGGVLFFLNRYIAHLVTVPWLRDFFLPVNFLIGLALIWVGWWIWELIRAEPPSSQYPSIDAAWDAGVQALAQAGLRLGDLPLFLLLGRPQGAEEHVFAAGQLSLVVKQTPPDKLAPVHIYASRDAVYVTCAGASLLGKHAANIALEGIEDQGMGGGGAEADGEVPEADRTIRPTGREKQVIKKLAQLVGRTMNIAERRAARRELNLTMPEVLKSPADVADLSARLAHLGKLITRDRHPECPINGVLLLVPIGGTDNDHDAQQTADVCARDLATVRNVLMLHCPVLVAACDLETVPGFRDFIEYVAPKERQARLGQRFPLASPDLMGEELEEQIDRSVHFLCNSYLRDWVYRLFQVDMTDGKDPVIANTGLYLFLDEMRARKNKLSRILVQGIAKNGPVPLLFAGCYLAATGGDKALEQAFVPGIFKRLEQNQSFVAWTDKALTDDRKYHTQANVGYGAIVIMILAFVGLLAFYILRKPPVS